MGVAALLHEATVQVGVNIYVITRAFRHLLLEILE